MAAHAKLSASAAHRWLYCFGSVKASEGMPNEGSTYAAEGTFAHEIAAATLNSVQRHSAWLGKKRIIDEKYEVECTQEMVDAVGFYMQVLGKATGRDDRRAIEVDLTPALQKVHPSLGGTADYIVYNAPNKWLQVYDFKYGKGVPVKAEDNEQMQMYALGALLYMGLPCNTVSAIIVQPRVEERVREWTFSPVHLLDFQAQVLDAIAEIEKPEPAIVPGWKQCLFCPAKKVCPVAVKGRAPRAHLSDSDFAVVDGAAQGQDQTPVNLFT